MCPDSVRTDPDTNSAAEGSFAETALRLGGKSVEEASRTGAIDRADDSVEKLFQPQYQTANSPVHRAVWERSVPVELFRAQSVEADASIVAAMDASIDVVRRHLEAKTLLDEYGKTSESVLRELGDVGYWGFLVSRQYGGLEVPFRSFSAFITRMATIDPTVAGMASVHGCIGAVDPVQTFGTPAQKERFLPSLASGERLSGFALTEPNAGSDMTALRTRAERDGDEFLVTGEKLFITNVVPGRTIGLVCLVHEKPAVLICELPNTENPHFQLKKYGLWALRQSYNQGIVFDRFRVPAENLLISPRGNGLTIAYHGLNLGRIALCANAAGTMRMMMASMLPWARFRTTYGAPISQRELVRRRLARLSGLIVGCDALSAWCSTLIDLGYRGEMECIVAKIFGSEAQKEAAIELLMKTHGGRSFLHGHLFGDNVHEYLAPCIYEGEGEMLGMAFLKSLVKQHGTTFFEPIGRALAEMGVQRPRLGDPRHLWNLRRPLTAYAAWWAGRWIPGSATPTPALPPELQEHVSFATTQLPRAAREISGMMRKHQLKLADRQCRMSEMSSRVQKLVVMLCTALYGADQEDEIVRAAADVLCQDLRRELTGERPTDRYYRQVTRLGESIVDGGFRSIASLQAEEILMPYEKLDARQATC